jgi:hypothetical protein
MLTSLFLATSLARASGNFPGELQTWADTPCTPSCIVCHATAAGGGGTATQPFAMALKERGLSGGGDSAALTNALDALEADAVDSNEDGTPDTEQLRAGVNPNDGAAFCGDTVADTPKYGCFQTVRGTLSPLALLALGAVLALRRRAPSC